MKKILFVLLVLLTGPAMANNSIANFLLVLGQSGAMNFGTVSQPFPGGWTSNPNIQIWNETTSAWEIYAPGVNSNGDSANATWGPEASYALAWAADHPTQVLRIVTRAIGGCPVAEKGAGICDWWPGHDSTGTDKQWGIFWQKFVNAATALPTDKLAFVDAALVVNGETDATVQADANAFAYNFWWLVNSLEARFWIFGTPVIASIPSNAFTDISTPYLSTVRSALSGLCTANPLLYGCVNVDDLTESAAHPGHLDPASTVTQGARMYAQRKAMHP